MCRKIPPATWQKKRKRQIYIYICIIYIYIYRFGSTHAKHKISNYGAIRCHLSAKLSLHILIYIYSVNVWPRLQLGASIRAGLVRPKSDKLVNIWTWFENILGLEYRVRSGLCRATCFSGFFGFSKHNLSLSYLSF